MDQMGPGELRAAARKSNRVLADLGSEIQWIHSYVVADCLYCLRVSPDEEVIRERSRLTGFPSNDVFEFAQLIDPDTGLYDPPESLTRSLVRQRPPAAGTLVLPL
ncbi:MAG: nickel-binding protein, partial [Longimicrobiales bacterium]